MIITDGRLLQSILSTTMDAWMGATNDVDRGSISDERVRSYARCAEIGLREAASACSGDTPALRARLINAADMIAMLLERACPAPTVDYSRFESPAHLRKVERRYEIVGLTKAEATRCIEAVAGAVMWDRNHSFASEELFARPMGCECAHCASKKPVIATVANN